jgi:hypothetical protein
MSKFKVNHRVHMMPAAAYSQANEDARGRDLLVAALFAAVLRPVLAVVVLELGLALFVEVLRGVEVLLVECDVCVENTSHAVQLADDECGSKCVRWLGAGLTFS